MTRHIVPSREVYHLWAQGNTNTGKDGAAIWARNSSDSVSFDGASAYSYRAIIGRIVTRKGKGRAYLLTTRTWSVTTSGHQSMLRSSIPSGEQVFNVCALDSIDSVSLHKERIADYMQRIAQSALKAKRARKSYSIEYEQGEVVSLTQELQAYCKYFGLRAPRVNVDTLRTDLETLRNKEKQQNKKRDELQRQRMENARVEWLAKADDWRNGLRDSLPWLHDVPTLLRVQPSLTELPANQWQVETSRGARVPYSVAMSLFSRWLSGKVASGDSVGPYTVSRFTDDSITIGCHVITMAEARRFAESQDWIGPEAETKTA